MVLYQAVQSLDETVLRNVKRQTIKLEAYEALQVHMRGRGLRSNSDLILGLPGETLQTHRAGLRKLLDSGISQVTNFQLMMLKGTELETEASRQEFKFRSAWRVLPKNFGVYGDEKVFDVEEIIVETDTLSFQDYLEARTVALASVAFWHDNYFEDVICFAESLGMRRSDWLDLVLERMKQTSGPVKKYLDDFLVETVNELFPTRQECIDFYSQEQHFERLRRGEFGDNLMHKYRAVASFHIWPAICECAMNTTRELILRTQASQEIPDFEKFWSNLERFVYLRHAWGYSTQEILSAADAEMTYDIAAWIADGKPKDPSKFKLTQPTLVRFQLSPDSRRELASALTVWTDQVRGLSKLVTRVRVECQVRRTSLVGGRSFASVSH